MICLQARRQSPAGLAEPARFGPFRVVPGCSGRSGHIRGCSAVADNMLTIKQKSTLPVGETRQDKPLFRSLSGAYLPPQTSCACVVGRGSIGLLSNNAPSDRQLMSIGASEHRAFVRAKARFAGQKAQEHILSVEMPFLPDIFAMYRWRHFRQSRSSRRHRTVWAYR